MAASTALSQQLRRIAIAARTSQAQNEKQKPSLLFEPQEAADIASHTIYELALYGNPPPSLPSILSGF